MVPPLVPPPPDGPKSPAPPDQPGGWVAARWEWFALGAVVVVVFALRYLVLLQGTGYPPSEDAGGDLYNARLWTTGAFGGATSALLYPPVYYFVVVIPLASILPVPLAVDVMMALVPAGLVIPAHYLLKRVDVVWPVALAVATVLAMCPVYSNMITWNSAYNMFAIVLMVAFFGLLLRYLDQPDRRSLFITALLFSLVIGSHELSAVVLVETTAVFFLLLAAVGAYRRRLRESLRPWGPLGVWLILFSLPWWPIYLYSYSHVTNVGYSAFLINWADYLWGGATQAWSGGSTLLYYIDAGVSLVGVTALAIRFPRRLQFSLLLLALFVGSISVGVLDSLNAVRGLLFLPIIFVLALAPPVSDAFRFLFRRPSERADRVPLDPSAGAAGRERRLLRSRGRPQWRMVTGVVLVAALAAFSGVNVAQSESVLQSSAAFNSVLTPQSLAVMQWLNSHASAGATVYTPSPLIAWAQYYEPNQNIIGPEQSSANVLTNGLNTLLLANEAFMGAYTVGNSYLAASMNYPGNGTPLVWIGGPGYNFLLGTSTYGLATIEVSDGFGTRTLLLDSATLSSESSQTSGSGGAGTMVFVWHWSSPDVSASETIGVTNTSLRIAWASDTPGVQVDSAGYGFRLPPSSYYYFYRTVDAVDNATVLSDGFSSIVGFGVVVPFDLTITPGGGTVSQGIESTGWATIQATFADNLTFAFSGLPGTPGLSGVYSANATALLHTLGVSYVLVDRDTASGLYSYVADLNATGFARSTVVDSAYPWYAFLLQYE